MTYAEFIKDLNIIRKSVPYPKWCDFVRKLECRYYPVRFSLFGDGKWIESYKSPHFKNIYNDMLRFKLEMV
jgi:hypothetical protein